MREVLVRVSQETVLKKNSHIILKVTHFKKKRKSESQSLKNQKALPPCIKSGTKTIKNMPLLLESPLFKTLTRNFISIKVVGCFAWKQSFRKTIRFLCPGEWALAENKKTRYDPLSFEVIHFHAPPRRGAYDPRLFTLCARI